MKIIMHDHLGIIITTIGTRKKALTLNINHLVQYIDVPFVLYVYNDAGPPMGDYLTNLLTKPNGKLVMLNDHKEISNVRVGCGGARHHLFEIAKSRHEVIASLDDDMQITPGWFQSIQAAMDEYPNHCVFTGLVKGPKGGIQIAGSKMRIKDNRLSREALRTIPGKYGLTDWGPLGCLVLCRKALQPNLQIPPLFVREDSAFYLELRKLGINQAVVARDAVAIHRPIPVPESDLRRPSQMKAAEEYYLKHHGLII